MSANLLCRDCRSSRVWAIVMCLVVAGLSITSVPGQHWSKKRSTFGAEVIKKKTKSKRQKKKRDIVRPESPLFGMISELAVRYVSGRRPVGKVAKGVYRVFSKADPQSVKVLATNWTSLSVRTQQRLVGIEALDALHSDNLENMDEFAATHGAHMDPDDYDPPPREEDRPAGFPTTCIDRVLISMIHCLDETNPEPGGSDSIFVAYVVTVGTHYEYSFVTGVYTGLEDRQSLPMSPQDAQVYPRPGFPEVCTSDITIRATVWEDDSEDLNWVNVVRLVLDAAGSIASTAGWEEGSDILGDAALGRLIDAIDESIEKADLINSDTVYTDFAGRLVGDDGRVRHDLDFVGDGGHYKLEGFRVDDHLERRDDDDDD